MIDAILTVLLVASFLINLRLFYILGHSKTIDGKMVIEETEDTISYRMELNDDPEYTLEGKKMVTFKVERNKG